MTDVRLTALNPVDSQVYPVACNDKGELLIEANEASGNLDVQGDLTVTGTGTFVNGSAEIQGQGFFVGTGFVSYKMAASSYAIHDDDVNWKYSVYYDGTTHIGGYITTADPLQDTPNIALNADGSGLFTKDLEVRSLFAGKPVHDAVAGVNTSSFRRSHSGLNLDCLVQLPLVSDSSSPTGQSILTASNNGDQVFNVATDGSAKFAGGGTFDSFLSSPFITSQTATGNATLAVVNTTTGNTEFQYVNGVGLTVNGAATFASGVCQITAAGTIGSKRLDVVPGDGGKYAYFYGGTGEINMYSNGAATFAGTVTAQNITFRIAPEVVTENPQAFVDDGFSSTEIDLLSELIKMKAEIKNLNAFMQKSIQESSET
jgi:hypothetical protein